MLLDRVLSAVLTCGELRRVQRQQGKHKKTERVGKSGNYSKERNPGEYEYLVRWRCDILMAYIYTKPLAS